MNEVTMHYKKFLIVREPMERLVSAFNDLFIVSDRKGLQREALKVRGARNRKITFNDFIKAVVLPQDSVGNFNSITLIDNFNYFSTCIFSIQIQSFHFFSFKVNFGKSWKTLGPILQNLCTLLYEFWLHWNSGSKSRRKYIYLESFRLVCPTLGVLVNLWF